MLLLHLGLRLLLSLARIVVGIMVVAVVTGVVVIALIAHLLNHLPATCRTR
jgi:hypothetical protein